MALGIIRKATPAALADWQTAQVVTYAHMQVD